MIVDETLNMPLLIEGEKKLNERILTQLDECGEDFTDIDIKLEDIIQS